MSEQEGQSDCKQLVTKKVNTLYSIMRSYESKLGGGEGTVGMYGSLSEASMQRVLDSLVLHCSMNSSSILVDVGAGLGRPLMHALVSPGVSGAVGIELDQVKVTKAQALIHETAHEMARRELLELREGAMPRIVCSGIEDVSSLDPVTHAYSFWEGVPIEGRIAFGSLFAASNSLQAVAVVQRAVKYNPVEVMCGLGFGILQLVDKFGVTMSGSRNGFTAYIFLRTETSNLHQQVGSLDTFRVPLKPYPKRKRIPSKKYNSPPSSPQYQRKTKKQTQSKQKTRKRPQVKSLNFELLNQQLEQQQQLISQNVDLPPTPPSSSSTTSVVFQHQQEEIAVDSQIQTKNKR
eukprot:TRINITY_DN3116_c2_g3_i2.p1 TRINITY_DN3116_c2_g3~~TRINITY_DN3116_c2_g3_i2.p1  ORF type:complete len:347 (+),score=29.02 TRINITY_DN3116_c2_g3_i2:142-1182(+)